MVRLENITVAYEENVILKNITAKADQGDFVIIVGHNGAGKTTLMQSITGKQPLSTGSIHINQINVSSMDELARSRYVTLVNQDPMMNCAPAMTVQENLLIASMKGRPAHLRIPNVNDITEVVDRVIRPILPTIDQLLHKPMQSLSGGQRQLIGFIMSVIKKPHLLLLDEPTAALDPVTAQKLITFIQRIVNTYKITTLMITHDLTLSKHLGNKIWRLEHGHLISN